jgi:hypothetical protein
MVNKLFGTNLSILGYELFFFLKILKAKTKELVLTSGDISSLWLN